MASPYEPAVTGLLLIFSLSLFIVAAENEKLELSEGLVLALYPTGVIAAIGGGIILLLGLVGGFLNYMGRIWKQPPNQVGIDPNDPNKSDSLWEFMGRPMVEGIIGTFDWVFGLFRWIPLEVAVVFFTLSFLVVATSGEGYAN